MTTAPQAPESVADVTVSVVRDPSLVRTVRLVTAAVARRAGLPDSLVEEVRLAVGEACAVMIGLDEEPDGSGDQVSVSLSTGTAFTVTVSGRVVGGPGAFAEMGLEPFALVRGLTEQLEVDGGGDLTSVRMTWPRS